MSVVSKEYTYYSSGACCKAEKPAIKLHVNSCDKLLLTVDFSKHKNRRGSLIDDAKAELKDSQTYKEIEGRSGLTITDLAVTVALYPKDMKVRQARLQIRAVVDGPLSSTLFQEVLINLVK